jgi:hypothetical protein
MLLLETLNTFHPDTIACPVLLYPINVPGSPALSALTPTLTLPELEQNTLNSVAPVPEATACALTKYKTLAMLFVVYSLAVPTSKVDIFYL